MNETLNISFGATGQSKHFFFLIGSRPRARGILVRYNREGREQVRSKCRYLSGRELFRDRR